MVSTPFSTHVLRKLVNCLKAAILLPLFTMTLQVCAVWTGSGYPDLRGSSAYLCGDHLPVESNYLPYVCDPDKVLKKAEVAKINARLHRLAIATPCHCQRESQCMTDDKNRKTFSLGFIVTVALVKDLQMSIRNASIAQLESRAQSFCRTLQGRWALGDCGNSAIIFVWQSRKMIYISTARVTTHYVTEREEQVILAQVQLKVEQGDLTQALLEIIGSMQKELNGDPEGRVDTGTLSLIIAVGVAVLLVAIITCCVCAFRCCGNLRPNKESSSRKRVGKADHRADSLRMDITRTGSQLRRSFSRSPKFPRFQPQPMNTTSASNNMHFHRPREHSPIDTGMPTTVMLGYYRDSDTTMV